MTDRTGRNTQDIVCSIWIECRTQPGLRQCAELAGFIFSVHLKENGLLPIECLCN